MIIDRLEHLSRYALMIKDCDKLDAFFRQHPLKRMEPGRYPIEDSDLVVNLFDYETKIDSATPWETHHTHMDIHIVVDGKEIVEWAPAQHITQSREYVTERDVEFFNDTYAGSRVLVEENYFCLVMPEDAHKPALSINNVCAKGRKIVVKVEV